MLKQQREVQESMIDPEIARQDRISQEDIIKTNESILQSVICPICLLIIPMPHYQCEQCNNTFCPDCLEEWWLKNPKSCVFKCQKGIILFSALVNFKLVKRSNTYNALMEVILTKCKRCEEEMTVSKIMGHNRNTCPETNMKCKYGECKFETIRRSLKEHEATCEFRQLQCQHCLEKLSWKQINHHLEEQCTKKMITCHNQGCQQIFAVSNKTHHQSSCPFIKQQCLWCQSFIFQNIISEHHEICPQRTFQCQWCSKQFFKEVYIEHVDTCDEKCLECKLCGNKIKGKIVGLHRQECMFLYVCGLKEENHELQKSNIELKRKVHELEEMIKESNQNRQMQTMDAIIKMKEGEKDQYKRDLLRLTNSIRSLEKLRQSQIDQHMKYPHLSTSLCFFCRDMKKKMHEELNPLRIQREEVNLKLAELERMENAQVSKIKSSKIKM